MPRGLIQLKCCGIMELEGLSWGYVGADRALLSLKDQILSGNKYHKKVPFILFSGITRAQDLLAIEIPPNPAARYLVGHKDYGQEFADFLLENKLGTVLASEEKENWTLNMIRIWLWSPDYDALMAWYAARDAKANG